MLTITETAGAHLAQLLAEANQPEEAAVRVERATTGALTLRFDQVQPDDLTVEHEERTVLVFDTEIAETLGDKTIDAREAEEGTKLVIQG
jgi:Fe-S cluster assembly iron-binding protein IscA